MRATLLILIAFVFAAAAPLARADAATDEFKARIEAALAINDATERSAAIGALFYREALDDWSQSLVERVIGIVAKKQGHDISFVDLSPDTDLIQIVDGFEYRPNLEPMGQVVFTDPAADPGNDTKVLYGRPALPSPGNEDRLFSPLTVRRLVNPNAPPDKQLQMIAIGGAHPPAEFEGWCDIALSNNTVKRITLDDQDIGNQTRIMRGQSIEACEVTNTGGRGSLSLRLYEGDREIFIRQIETPEATITYRKP
ncbi:MAG: hypothetical protein HKN28_11950 [Alphaproteobacteria bacterium]|nr:hypothetical protein [Alphaproteobacteria bacterium]